MTRTSLVWRIFLLLEFVAVISAYSSGYFRSPFLWTVGFILMLPGLLLAGPLVEHALWMSRVSLTVIGLLEVGCSLAVNALLIWVGIFAVRQVRRRVAL